MMRTPDGHGRLELSRFLEPPVVADHRTAPVQINTDILLFRFHRGRLPSSVAWLGNRECAPHTRCPTTEGPLVVHNSSHTHPPQHDAPARSNQTGHAKAAQRFFMTSNRASRLTCLHNPMRCRSAAMADWQPREERRQPPRRVGRTVPSQAVLGPCCPRWPCGDHLGTPPGLPLVADRLWPASPHG